MHKKIMGDQSEADFGISLPNWSSIIQWKSIWVFGFKIRVCLVFEGVSWFTVSKNEKTVLKINWKDQIFKNGKQVGCIRANYAFLNANGKWAEIEIDDDIYSFESKEMEGDPVGFTIGCYKNGQLVGIYEHREKLKGNHVLRIKKKFLEDSWIVGISALLNWKNNRDLSE